METSLDNFPANTNHLYNIHTMLDQRYITDVIYVIQMFCVCWVKTFKIFVCSVINMMMI